MAVAELLEDPDVEQIDYTLRELPKGYELIDGELVEMPEMGFRASFIASRIDDALGKWCESTQLGTTASAEASYMCFGHRKRQVRKPDTAVILCDPKTFVPPDPHCAIVPAVTVEVVSPHERADDLAAKIDDFLRAGTKLVWEVRPASRDVVVHYPDLTSQKIREDGTLSGEDVLPGFTMSLSAIFPPV